MKAILEFNLPEEREDHILAVTASNLVSALSEVREKLFRPVRKHGYPEGNIKKIFNLLDEEKATELIAALETEFNNILEENEVLKFT